MPRVKFCGITNLTDAHNAAVLGLAYLGFIFVENTKRYIEPAKAKSIIDSLRQSNTIPGIVGVFQNASLETMKTTASLLNLDLVQCHGEESPELLQQVGKPCIKTLTVSSHMTLDDLASAAKSYTALAQQTLPFFILDLPKDDPAPETIHTRLLRIAGTPEALQKALGEKPYCLAGKLTAETVSELTTHWQPFALDVASGIEQAPGIKSPEKMQNFMETLEQTTSI